MLTTLSLKYFKNLITPDDYVKYIYYVYMRKATSVASVLSKIHSNHVCYLSRQQSRIQSRFT